MWDPSSLGSPGQPPPPCPLPSSPNRTEARPEPSSLLSAPRPAGHSGHCDITTARPPFGQGPTVTEPPPHGGGWRCRAGAWALGTQARGWPLLQPAQAQRPGPAARGGEEGLLPSACWQRSPCHRQERRCPSDRAAALEWRRLHRTFGPALPPSGTAAGHLAFGSQLAPSSRPSPTQFLESRVRPELVFSPRHQQETLQSQRS